VGEIARRAALAELARFRGRFKAGKFSREELYDRERPSETNIMKSFDRIVIDPAIRFGKPCVRGTRITVGEVLGYLAEGKSEAELIGDFSQLTHEDVLACFGFAAERERQLSTS
jgi:uncharacterized protein (DUF433 family)